MLTIVYWIIEKIGLLLGVVDRKPWSPYAHDDTGWLVFDTIVTSIFALILLCAAAGPAGRSRGRMGPR